MKILIEKSELQGILNIVSAGMSSRATLPILAGILITAKDSKAVFQTTDLEVSVRHQVLAQVEEEGQIVVSGDILNKIVKALPDAAVTIDGNQANVNITCMESKYQLSALNPADFPYFPEVDAENTIELPVAELAEGARHVIKAASHDESRPTMTGVFMDATPSQVRLVATDMYRVAVYDFPIETGATIQVIIPAKTLSEVVRSAAGCEMVQIAFAQNQLVFKFGGTTFVSRKIEGNYPNYQQLLNYEHRTVVKVDAEVFNAAINRVKLLAASDTPVRFKFTAEDQHVTILARQQDVGFAQEVVEVEMEGEDTEIAFNYRYFQDGLSVISGGLELVLQANGRPGVLKPAGREGFVYINMPVRL